MDRATATRVGRDRWGKQTDENNKARLIVTN